MEIVGQKVDGLVQGMKVVVLLDVDHVAFEDDEPSLDQLGHLRPHIIRIRLKRVHRRIPVEHFLSDVVERVCAHRLLERRFVEPLFKFSCSHDIVSVSLSLPYL